MNSHSLLAEMRSDTDTLEDSVTVSHKSKHRLTTESNNHIPRNLFNCIESLYPYKILLRNVYLATLLIIDQKLK